MTRLRRKMNRFARLSPGLQHDVAVLCVQTFLRDACAMTRAQWREWDRQSMAMAPVKQWTVDDVMSTRQMRTARAFRAIEAHRAVHGAIVWWGVGLGHPASVCPSCDAPRRDDDGSSERITFTCGSSMASHRSASKIGTYGTLTLGECADHRPLPTWNGRVAPRAEASVVG